ncbi:MAG: hypothetical protein EOO89_27640 [Pedobacter sp.]|nr:MAG: hypothetical protein EOO89_27640 [Pedobacter sp.]
MLGAYFSSKTLTTNSYLLTGLRYKNNSSLLSRQDDKGTYAPNFMDAQVIYHQDLSSRVGVNLLASFNSGTFKLTPESRETQFGTSSTLMKLQTDYAGQEIDDYQTAGAAVTLSYTPQSTSVFKWINSYFTTLERERIDIEGRYVLSGRNGSLEDLTDEEGNTNSTIGGYANYARNNLESRYFSSELKLDKYYNSHTFSAGWRFEQKKYDDELYEYSLIDSGEDVSQGGTVNYYQDNLIDVQNRLTIRYYTGYIQDSYQISANTDLQLGVRTNYNSLSNQFLVSPRLLMAYRPESNTKIFRFSAGIYQQAPDYRSIRGFDGRLQLNQKAQRSYNTSVGLDYAFDGLGTRLKFTSELYFKYQDRLIPYMMDNVRIKYLAGEVAQGYTYGTDFTIGGEFVKDLLSYFRISFMKSNGLTFSLYFYKKI